MSTVVKRKLFNFGNNNNNAVAASSIENATMEEHPCKSLWDTGIPTSQDTPYRDYFQIPAYQYKNCTKSETLGKYYYVNARKLANNTTGALRNPYLKEFPILSEVPSRPGVYTWIIYASGSSSEKQIAFCKAYSWLELGTKHNIIAVRVGATTIYAAGEFALYQDGTKRFNFQSGTYMQKRFEALERRRSCTPDEFQDYLITQIQPYFGEPAATFQTATFIDRKLLPSPDEELAIYEKYGLLEVFDTEEACKKHYQDALEAAIALQGGRRYKRTYRTLKNKRNRMKHGRHGKSRRRVSRLS